MLNLEMQFKFGEIYTCYRSMVYSVSLHYLQDSYLAEDATQNTFESLFHVFLEHGTFVDQELECEVEIDQALLRKYLYVAARNQAFNLYHKSKNRKMHLLSIDLTGEDLVTTENDIVTSLVEKEALEDLLRRIDGLGEKYTPVMKLKYLEQRTSKEIAGLLDMNYDTVRKRLERGKEKLLADLERK